MKTKVLTTVVFVLCLVFALAGCCGAIPTSRIIVVTATPAVPAPPTPTPVPTPIPTKVMPTVPPTSVPPTRVPPTAIPPTSVPPSTKAPTPASTEAPSTTTKIVIAGRASAREFTDGIGYYVNFGILNISDSNLKTNEIRGVFMAGSSKNGLTVKGRKLGFVSWEIKPGEKTDHYFDTEGHTAQLLKDSGGGKIVLGISLYLDDKVIPGTGPFYAELPPLGDLGNEGINLVFSTTEPKDAAFFPLS